MSKSNIINILKINNKFVYNNNKEQLGYTITKLTVRQLNYLKNYINGNLWVNNVETAEVLYLDLQNTNKLKITRISLKNELKHYLLKDSISPKFASKLLNLFDSLTILNGVCEINIDNNIFEILLAMGILEMEEYQNRTLPITLETLYLL
jgi:hypothetical protein